MGRASNRKKARRRAGNGARQTRRSSPAEATAAQALQQAAAGLQAWSQEITRREGQEVAARRVWCSGSEPVPAEMPPWPEGSVGARFFSGMQVQQARQAPCLLTADIPGDGVITASPAHWNVAACALIRAVIFDGLAIDHPIVSRLACVLTPIAEAELAYGEAIEDWLHRGGRELDEDEPEFPELDGPVFLLGGSALIDAVWAVVGEDPLSEVLRVMLPVLERAVPGRAGRNVADALIGAFATHYRCELPGDADVLAQIRRPNSGDALENLVAAGTVPAQDILRLGLMVLSALADLCRSDSVSVIGQAA